ncbi:unknown [Coprobacillus sp. CAG:698]|nr:unknown [Coprobacillus sp. CAG:698]
MFINTVQENKNFETGKKKFDSRFVKKQVETKEIRTILIDKSKIENVVVLYKHNMPVVCEISLDDIVYEGIPTDIFITPDKQELDVLVNEEHIKVDLSKIRDFKILEI